MNARSVLIAAAALLAIVMAGCTKNPASSDDGSKQQENAAKAQAESDSAAAAMLLPAYQANREASSHVRLMASKGSVAQPAAQPGAGTPVLGTPVPISAKDLSPKRQPDIATALLKRAVLGKISAAAAGGDSSWFVLDDSSHGHILWVHAFLQTEAGAAVEARDTLVYKWPYGPDNRTVLGHSGTRDYANGARLAYAISDEDGDGMLNEATPGTRIRLRKQWITVHADTAWKSVHHTVHGFTNFYDSIGPGSDTGWTDTVFVGGKMVSWDRLLDGDGDGFVLTAAAGKKVRVNRDAYVQLGTGVFRLDHESFGPGADGDFLAADDNERYPYNSQTIDVTGHTLALTRYGDGDGDGFYFDPAAAAGGNRAYIVNEYPANDSVKAWTDSLAQILSGPGGADAKVAAYASAREYLDGRKLKVFSRVPGKDAFGPADTAQIWEKWDLTGQAARGDADSALRVTWMIPGELGDPSDDKLTQTYSQTWNRPGVAAISSSELLTATVPFAPGQAASAGTLTREERRNPVSSKSLIRTVWYQEFGASGSASDWRRTDYFESGDSAISTGSGASGGSGNYTQVLGPEARNSGAYDAASGIFADTTAFLGPKGETRAREISWGQVDAAKGTGDYRVKRVGGKDTSTAHVTAVADGKDLVLTRIEGSDTLLMRLAGDSAVLERTVGGVKRTYTWTAASGAYQVSERDVDGKGSALATGLYFFGQDMSGSGTLTRTPAGKPAADSHVQFQSDGSAFLDGIRVYP
ncbi:MAG: hypothetical protein JF616_03235 [Fibrobacteres bacterium]|nr:hypothetical protein [Fibrobacterota bacterium]